MHNFDQADATAIAESVRSAVVNAETVAEHFLECVDTREPIIKAFVSFDPEGVRRQARQLQNGHAKGLLAGVPVGVKDIYDTVDHPTRFYSPIYEDNRPSMSSRCCARPGR
jgi:Asp-tRNA(Asn)/Glu-tRNA(Gln) amidotransferase A subunit family amidase